MIIYFSFKELIYSSTANAYGVSNIPERLDIYRNLYNLMENLLDPLRKELGVPIRVLSGYRCEKVNQIVGGVPNSQHCEGEAADITTLDNNKLRQLWGLIKSNRWDFDQAIYYEERRFIHVSLRRMSENRRQTIVNYST